MHLHSCVQVKPDSPTKANRSLQCHSTDVSQVVEVREPTVYRSGSVRGDEWSARQLAQCRSGDLLYSVVGFSELLVKLEISLTLLGEIDNSNVKEVEEVSA